MKRRYDPEDSAASQDYLAAIHGLARGGRPVIGIRLARHVGVSPPAASEAIRRLTRWGYVRIGQGKRLLLTTRGREVATATVRRRRLLERWLMDALGLGVIEAHEDAHRLEHVLSPRVERRLAEHLGVAETGHPTSVLDVRRR